MCDRDHTSCGCMLSTDLSRVSTVHHTAGHTGTVGVAFEGLVPGSIHDFTSEIESRIRALGNTPGVTSADRVRISISRGPSLTAVKVTDKHGVDIVHNSSFEKKGSRGSETCHGVIQPTYGADLVFELSGHDNGVSYSMLFPDVGVPMSLERVEVDGRELYRGSVFPSDKKLNPYLVAALKDDVIRRSFPSAKEVMEHDYFYLTKDQMEYTSEKIMSVTLANKNISNGVRIQFMAWTEEGDATAGRSISGVLTLEGVHSRIHHQYEERKKEFKGSDVYLNRGAAPPIPTPAPAHPHRNSAVLGKTSEEGDIVTSHTIAGTTTQKTYKVTHEDVKALQKKADIAMSDTSSRGPKDMAEVEYVPEKKKKVTTDDFYVDDEKAINYEEFDSDSD